MPSTIPLSPPWRWRLVQGKFLPRTSVPIIKPLVTCSVKVTNRRHSISNDGLAQLAHFDALTPVTSLNESGLHSGITCAFNARSLTRKDLFCDLPYTSPFRPPIQCENTGRIIKHGWHFEELPGWCTWLSIKNILVQLWAVFVLGPFTVSKFEKRPVYMLILGQLFAQNIQ